MAQIRLDKYLADMQLGSRSQVKQYIRKGLVTVDSKVVTKPEQKVDTDDSEICLEGKAVAYHCRQYYMLNKPQGVVSATVDLRYPTVVDLITEKKRSDLFPVGRLDVDTEGLLLITNDGELCHNLLSPKKHVDKCYYVIVQGRVTVEDIAVCEEGIDIGTDEQPLMTAPAKLVIQNIGMVCELPERLQEIVQKQGEAELVSQVYLTIQEGRYHQVKKMFARLGKPVLYLKRISMGSLVLDENLAPGTYRELTKAELDCLQQ